MSVKFLFCFLNPKLCETYIFEKCDGLNMMPLTGVWTDASFITKCG